MNFFKATGFFVASRALIIRRAYCDDDSKSTTSETNILSQKRTMDSLGQALKSSLPKDWTYAFNSDGVVYYYNTLTGESRWERPDDISRKSEVSWDTKWDGRSPNKHQATHQIVLIRHGQYVHEPENDAENVLTELGRKQADLTGRRLKELINTGIVLPVRSVYYSTMKRATETGQLVIPHIPAGANIEPCSMIREGAVCRPIPPSVAWKVTDEEFDKEGLRVS
jgi:hypothetical protein